MPERHSLPPMEAVEFAIDKAFRHCFFALGLLIGWSVVLLPLAALAWLMGVRGETLDVRALPPAALLTLGVLCLAILLASFSIEVNWNRRILLDERPRLLQRWRLDGAVWRYFLGVLFLLVVLAIYAAIGVAVMMMAVPALVATLGAAAQSLGIAVTVLVGLSALFTLYRLMSWLAGLATDEEGYSLGDAWRATKRNRVAFLAFTFWLLFTLAVAGGIGAGAFFAQQTLPQPWVKPVAFAVIGIVAWLALLILHSVPAALYRVFR